jgi:uncharacterized membrane protein SpoIIM required for sporulation
VTETLPAFVERRRPRWDELEALVGTAKGSVTRLDPASVRRLGSGYRQAAADLAQARRRFPTDPVTTHLESLVGRARPLVYSSVTERGSVAHFATTGYWRRVRERPRILLLSALVLFGPMLVMGVWSHGHPAEATRVAKVSAMTSNLGERPPRDADTQKETDGGVNAGLSGFIFTNNARVALLAFAGGMTAGIFTLYSLAFNGLVIGLVFGLSIKGGYGDSVWRLIIPHGVLELSLIVSSGAAGLRLGWALLRPGHRTRAEALGTEGRASVELALGSAALLVPCGIVEGYVTPRGLSLPSALAVGIGLGALYWGLVLWRGRPDPMAAEPGAELTGVLGP